MELPEHSDRLPPDYELCLFRVAQECLTNIHRHLGSSTAVVRLLQTPEEVKLEVKDEGPGINRETRSKLVTGDGVGVGLRGMRERLRRLGGNLEIESNGKGTLVAAYLPVEPPKTANASR
ncbi:MAG: ATP-binding protein [Candidatus Sulfotelmatobacter sp.]